MHPRDGIGAVRRAVGVQLLQMLAEDFVEIPALRQVARQILAEQQLIDRTGGCFIDRDQAGIAGHDAVAEPGGGHRLFYRLRIGAPVKRGFQRLNPRPAPERARPGALLRVSDVQRLRPVLARDQTG